MMLFVSKDAQTKISVTKTSHVNRHPYASYEPNVVQETRGVNLRVNLLLDVSKFDIDVRTPACCTERTLQLQTLAIFSCRRRWSLCLSQKVQLRNGEQKRCATE